MLGTSVFFGAKNLQKATSFFKMEYFVTNILFSKEHSQKKNHKLCFKDSIGIIITTTNYNFEETFENVLSEQSKIGLRILATLIALGK